MWAATLATALVLAEPVAAASPLAAGATGSSSPDTVLFASPTGQGSTCSQTAPCSLFGAQHAVRGIDAAMRADIVVSLEDATSTAGSADPVGYQALVPVSPLWAEGSPRC